MPFEFTWEPDGVYVRYHGLVTNEDMAASAEAIFEDPRWRRCRYYIADASEADLDELSLDDLREIAARHRSSALKNTRVAGVAILRNMLARLIAQAYSATGGRWSLYVADDESDAREHLGLDPMDFDS